MRDVYPYIYYWAWIFLLSATAAAYSGIPSASPRIMAVVLRYRNDTWPAGLGTAVVCTNFSLFPYSLLTLPLFTLSATAAAYCGIPNASSSQAMIAGVRHRASGSDAASRRAASLPSGDQARAEPVPA